MALNRRKRTHGRPDFNRGGGASIKYQDCIQPAQAWGDTRLAEPNINPVNGLATDYLNHFNEAIMLLETLSRCPDCVEDFLAWWSVRYREHFTQWRFKGRDVAIVTTPPSPTMTAKLEATRMALDSGLPPEAGGLIAEAVAAPLKPLIARAGALINGEADTKRDEP